MKKLILLIFFLFILRAYSQVEHVPVVHPVYNYLLRGESMGMLPHYSLSDLPLQRSQVIDALKLMQENKNKLSKIEQTTLEDYLTEFQILDRKHSVVIPSKSDSNQVFISGLISNDEKFIYRFEDDRYLLNLEPLGNVDYKYANSEPETEDYLIGNLGFRMYGSLDNRLGYMLQATNGSLISGSRELASQDPIYRQNIKFIVLNDDIDFTESHLRFQYDWFYAVLGRETRLMGAGLGTRLFTSNNAPTFDALSLGARFKQFEYKFMHGSILAQPEDPAVPRGAFTEIPSKYYVMQRFAVRPSWGEIAFWESIIYGGRSVDLAYLNPLSFFKSIEHATRDRDNAAMGIDFTVRPVERLQLKGTFLLDDIIFEKIGTGAWENKFAWNIAAITSLPAGLDFGFEYTRVKPFTFSHFYFQNAMTHDGFILGTSLQPNSEQYTTMLRWWYGNRYPIELVANYRRHGRNILDENGEIIRNVGGDVFETIDGLRDARYFTFLDGDLEETLQLELRAGYEIVRGFNIFTNLALLNVNGNSTPSVRIKFAYGDF